MSKESVPLLQPSFVKLLLLLRTAHFMPSTAFCRSRMHARYLPICIFTGECSTAVRKLTRFWSVCRSPCGHHPGGRPENDDDGAIKLTHFDDESGR